MTEPLRPETNTYQDPRMRGFRTRTPVEEVVARIDRRVCALARESVSLSEAGGRVLATEVISGEEVPPFHRAAMDGYALRGEETFGADAYNPARFRRIGSSRPGQAFSGVVGSGEAVQIMTGAPVPEGADAVVRVESTRADGDAVFVVEPTPPGRHVGRRGEDIPSGIAVLPAGRVLRPQDLGVLSALGVSSPEVIRQPSVAILITGDELLPPGTPSRDARIADMNSVMLNALIVRDGGKALVLGPLADDRARLRETLAEAASHHDLLLVSGGSSTGPEDHAPSLVGELGELTVHGIALRPASPAGIGWIGEVPVVLLPGNPVSCLCAYDLFAGRIVRRLGGRSPDWPYRATRLTLSQKLVSALGRVDYARVKRQGEGQVEPLGHQRRLDPVEHHPRRRLRPDSRRPRRLSRRRDCHRLALRRLMNVDRPSDDNGE